MADLNISAITQLAQGIDLGFGGTLVGIIAMLMICLIITRNSEKLKMLMFPIATMLWIPIGFQIHAIILGITGIIYALTIYRTSKIFQEYIVPNPKATASGIKRRVKGYRNWQKYQKSMGFK